MKQKKQKLPVNSFEALFKKVFMRVPRGLDAEWIRHVVWALCDLSYEEYAQRRYTDDCVGDVLVFEGERRFKERCALADSKAKSFDKSTGGDKK
jgi:hypothetical protein